MNRRDFLKKMSAATGVRLTPVLATAFLSGCAPEPGAPFAFLTAREAALVDSIAEGIIPATDTPGARAAVVVGYMDMLLAEFSSGRERRGFRKKLRRTASALDRLGATTLDDLSAVDRTEFLAEMQAEGDFFETLKAWTVVGYYSSEIGMTEELRVKHFSEWKPDISLSEVSQTSV